MKIEDINHLAKLSRIRVTPVEAEALTGEFDEILGYVAHINDAIDVLPDTRVVPLHANVFREDVVRTESGVYTEVLLDAAPARHKQYVVVKKILSGSDE